MFDKIYSHLLSEEISQLDTALIAEKKGSRCTKVTGQQSSAPIVTGCPDPLQVLANADRHRTPPQSQTQRRSRPNVETGRTA